MSKAVMISIQSKWVAEIASGNKTIEVRKTKPKLETPFKVYIYETYDKKYVNTGTYFFDTHINYVHKCSKVIGEFECDRIDTYFYGEMKIPTPAYDGDDSCIDCGEGYYITCGELKETCLTYEEFENYGKGRTLYGWHISNLVIYDKPKELSEFCRNGECDKCGWFENGKCYKKSEQSTYNNHRIKRPPQSWCYVEEQK